MRPASPFQAQGETSPGKSIGLRCATAGSTSPRLGHKGFAVNGPLALLGSASYPVPVRRPAASLPASFTPSSRSDPLRFAPLAVTSSREDFHLQVDAHAGRTKNKATPDTAPLSRTFARDLARGNDDAFRRHHDPAAILAADGFYTAKSGQIRAGNYFIKAVAALDHCSAVEHFPQHPAADN